MLDTLFALFIFLTPVDLNTSISFPTRETCEETRATLKNELRRYYDIKCIPVPRKRKTLDCTVENYNHHIPFEYNRYVHTFPAVAKIKCKESP